MGDRVVIATLNRTAALRRVAVWLPALALGVVMGLGLLFVGLFERRWSALVGSVLAWSFFWFAGRYPFWLAIRLATGSRLALYVEADRLVHLHRLHWSRRLDQIGSVQSVPNRKGPPDIYLSDREGRGYDVPTDILREKISPTIKAIRTARRALQQ